MLGAASIAYALGAPILGAALGLLVAALALLAAATGFCTGCEAYKLLCRVTGKPFVSCPIPEASLPRSRSRQVMTWQFSLAGLLVGILVGMTGMGGGSLMTPILILLFDFDAKVAVGTDILHGAIFKSFGAARHRHARDGARAARALDARRLGAAVARRRPGRRTHMRHGPAPARRRRSR